MRNIGSASLILLIISFIAVIAFGFFPLPHYTPDSGWYSGPSFFQKLMGTKDSGLSADKVFSSFAKANLESPYKLTCQTDLDCTTYKVLNQCQTYCGNSQDENKEVTESLSKNRVCDPAGWTPTKLDCRCIMGSCLDINK